MVFRYYIYISKLKKLKNNHLNLIMNGTNSFSPDINNINRMNTLNAVPAPSKRGLNSLPPEIRNFIFEFLIKGKMVASSAYHMIILTKAGKAVACGKNSRGQLGLGFEEQVHPEGRAGIAVLFLLS